MTLFHVYAIYALQKRNFVAMLFRPSESTFQKIIEINKGSFLNKQKRYVLPSDTATQGKSTKILQFISMHFEWCKYKMPKKKLAGKLYPGTCIVINCPKNSSKYSSACNTCRGKKIYCCKNDACGSSKKPQTQIVCRSCNYRSHVSCLQRKYGSSEEWLHDKLQAGNWNCPRCENHDVPVHNENRNF